MVELHIREDDVQRYLYFIIIFNALFPKVLEESNMIIYIIDSQSGEKLHGISYWNFLNTYDHYGFNEIAR